MPQFKTGDRVALDPHLLTCHDVRARCPWGRVFRVKEWAHGEELAICLDDGTLAFLTAGDVTLQPPI